jgi:hypothetical protein
MPGLDAVSEYRKQHHISHQHVEYDVQRPPDDTPRAFLLLRPGVRHQELRPGVRHLPLSPQVAQAILRRDIRITAVATH